MKQKIQSLQIIHLALCMGVSIFAAVTIMLVGKEANLKFSDNTTVVFAIVAMGIAFGASLFSGVLARRFWMSIQPSENNEEKFGKFQTGAIIEWALLEGAALLSIVGFLMYHNYFFLMLGISLLLLLLSKRPSKQKISEVTGIPERELD